MLQGEQYTLKDGFSSGYGFDGLVVGLLARGSVTGVLAAALLFGFLRSGGINMEMVAGGADGARRRHPGPDRHHAGRRDACSSKDGSDAMTWELFAVFLGSSHAPRDAAAARRRPANWSASAPACST